MGVALNHSLISHSIITGIWMETVFMFFQIHDVTDQRIVNYGSLVELFTGLIFDEMLMDLLEYCVSRLLLKVTLTLST